MNIFNPNSKFMYYLGITGDLIILNALFFVCCLPVFTIGAAQAGLYTGLRNILDRDSANTPAKSFFKGFKSGFGKITVVWLIFLLGIGLLSYSIYFIYAAELGAKLPTVISIIGVVMLAIIFAQISMFHSKFDCQKMQLVRNGIIVTFAYPIKSVIIGLLTWLPFGLFLINEYILIWGTPLWMGIYFSFAFQINASLMEKGYKRLTGESDTEDNKEETEE